MRGPAKERTMPPVAVPAFVKIALGALGAAAIVHWALKEVRRINERDVADATA
jgi:hypothetical protein